ncbi:expressed hypothetical protein [Trichoplax adhaerens]|uniref:Uncharacterized protein n=1 Tax=Trichoplax adhaerens TaxID=10228 RepID=B3RT97_TRIAD|nr:expressed hypothetical protein [Trichoplax adhaerens]EDV27189.1 expressed hypothetical protein [Trichoplax adhaerens]|eukprot:XP_002111185.1 expressed hypothetical protein [Trichoplax adhaerens]
MERVDKIFGHLTNQTDSSKAVLDLLPTSSASKFSQPHPDDVVVVSAKRTAICKANRGSFKDTHPADLLAAAFNAVMNETKVDPEIIGDIQVGNVLHTGSGAVLARMTQFYCGLPETIPLSTCNRQCASGLQAVANIIGEIKTGAIDVGIGAGLENMTLQKVAADDTVLYPKLLENELAKDCLIPMGITSENVAHRFGITRQQQDFMGYLSQQKAAKALEEGKFKDEIIPVKTQIKMKNGETKEILVDTDDGIRKGTTMETLAKLKPAFNKDGSTTAGNSSQRSDGAAAVMLAKRSTAERLGLPILGKFIAYAVAGVPPDVMGIGPAFAIPKVMKMTDLSYEDVDIFEINEAFASQATYCVQKLGIPLNKVNPNGGAIAMGHPLGCTGARMVATLLHELKRREKRAYGIVSMCMGSGMGAAAIFEHNPAEYQQQ